MSGILKKKNEQTLKNKQTKKHTKAKLTGTENRSVVARGGGRVREIGEGGTKEKTQAMPFIRLTAKYHFKEVLLSIS